MPTHPLFVRLPVPVYRDIKIHAARTNVSVATAVATILGNELKKGKRRRLVA